MLALLTCEPTNFHSVLWWFCEFLLLCSFLKHRENTYEKYGYWVVDFASTEKGKHTDEILSGQLHP